MRRRSLVLLVALAGCLGRSGLEVQREGTSDVQAGGIAATVGGERVGGNKTTTIGGGNDSLALQIAVTALGLAVLSWASYPILRALRLRIWGPPGASDAG